MRATFILKLVSGDMIACICNTNLPSSVHLRSHARPPPFRVGELVVSLDDAPTAEAVQSNGTEWVRFWDSLRNQYYFLNIVTNEIRYT